LSLAVAPAASGLKPGDVLESLDGGAADALIASWSPPAEPNYAGKVVILVDEVSQSQAEYTAMAFRASPHAVVVGSTTAGADGETSGARDWHPSRCDRGQL
jgi:C-terminal processing protease CtpA/Prc